MNFVFCVFCVATLVSECLLKEVDDKFKRSKRQNDASDSDEMWSWGPYEPAQPEQPIIKSKLTESEEPTSPERRVNPCDEPLPTKPDFNTPGRRVSEINCYEYIWGIKAQDDKEKQMRACTQYQNSLTGTVSISAIGGRDAEIGEFPHMAAVGWKPIVGTWIFKCGGSLISSKFVLTAAHCTRASELDTTIADVIPKIVRLGDKNIIDTFANDVLPTDVNISRIIVHPSYKAPKKYFDIALMELGKTVDFTNLIMPACLWTKADTSPLGSKATLTGWGVIETAGRTTSPELQAADVDVIDNGQCDQLLRPMCNRNWCGIQEHQICAGKLAGGVDACQGDSGGPLQMKIPLPPSTKTRMHHVIGVTSFGFGCALENTPGVYTRVSSFIDWIESVVWK